ncbi:MAG TPA: histidine phosphatase family protein, partial [Patescibacteria group bacterium]|nr:histidine phosphatase family protein [Patescibacteria group bacterium]
RETRPAGESRCCDRERDPIPTVGPARDDGQARLTLDLYLVRHGETEWSANGRHTGSTDLPLTAEGEREAQDLRRRLAGLGFDTVYSSPLQRSRRTAELAGYPNPEITPLLKEVDYGDYEGLTTQTIRESNPGWELFSDGCPGGETPAQIYARAQEFIALAASSGPRVLAFAHGHILRAVGVAWLGVDVTFGAALLLDVATLSMLRDADRRSIAMWNAP